MEVEELIKEVERKMEECIVQLQELASWDDLGKTYIRGKMFAYDGIKYLLYRQKYEEEKKKWNIEK